MTTSSFDIEQIEKLISLKDFAGAKKLLDDAVDHNMTEEEKGEIYTKIASAYLEATHAVNQEYIKKLDETIELMEEVEKTEKKEHDKLKVMEVKLGLQKDSE